MKLLCLYYSATGNTKRAVEMTRKRLETSGVSMDIVEIRKGLAAPALAGYEGVMIAFPVLAFNPPVFVRRFIRSMPEGRSGDGKRMRAYVLAVDGGGGRSAAARATLLLERRGYEAVATSRASFAANWAEFFQPSGPETAARINARGDVMMGTFYDAVSPGGAKRGGVERGSIDRKVSFIDIAVGFLFGAVGRRYFGKFFYADEDCNACGLCVRRCPSATILLGEGRQARPFWKSDCENCNACINICPTKAINTSIGRLIVLMTLVVAISWAAIRAYFTFVKPLFAGAVAPALGAWIDAFAVLIALLLGHTLPLWPIDRYVLRYVQRIPGLRKFFAWTFTKNWRRYRAESV